MKTWWLALLMLGSKLGPDVLAQPQAQTAVMTVEPEIERAGGEYQAFQVGTRATWGMCRDACQKDPKCQAYTYVKRGVQGRRARCSLKSEMPPAMSDKCCVSGVKLPAAVRDEQHLTAASPPRNSVGSAFVPIYVYYLRRYFENVPLATDTDKSVARILGDARKANIFLRNALSSYDAMSGEDKRALFDERTLELAASWQKPLNLAAVRGRIAELVPYLDARPPDAPTNLAAKNGSKLPNPDIPGSDKYAITLTWTDNSQAEDGFLIYRAYRPATPGQLPFSRLLSDSGWPETQLAGSVSRNITQFTDTLPKPPAAPNQNQYCYQVVAYKMSKLVLAGRAQEQIPSTASNTACSYYDPALLLAPPPPDSDRDGIADASDECPYERGDYPHGCPDLDADGVPNKDDACPLHWGELNNGCPMRYSLRFMGMKILNNSEDASQKGKFSYNEANAIDLGPGEEPYLVFTLVNGPVNSLLLPSTTRWYSGEGVDVKLGKDWEPDEDPTGEEHPLKLNDVREHGVPVFPNSPGLKFGEIDPESKRSEPAGLLMMVTLMERDDKVLVNAGKAESDLQKVFQSAKEVFKDTIGCVETAGIGCVEMLAGSFKSLVEALFGGNSPPPIEVEDPDDFMGTDFWAITRQDAYEWTSTTGAYPFYLSAIPSAPWRGCYAIPCTFGDFNLTMRVRPYFCLYREGVPDKDVKTVCTQSPQWVLPSFINRR